MAEQVWSNDHNVRLDIDFEFDESRLRVPLLAGRLRGEAAYIYLAFPNEPALLGLSDWYVSTLRAVGIPCEPQKASRFHCTLVYLDAATDNQLDAIFNRLSLPLSLNPEISRTEKFGNYLAANVAADPGLIRIQSELYRLAKQWGAQPSLLSDPEKYRPHISIVCDLDEHVDLSWLDMMGSGRLPLHIPTSEIVIGREDYEKVRTVRLPIVPGDRPFIEQGGAWVWPVPIRRQMVNPEVLRSVLRGETVVMPVTGRTLHRGMPLRGGPGSGHFGHEGRLGEVGGSAPTGGEMEGMSPGFRDSPVATELPIIRRRVEQALRDRQANHIREVFPPGVSPSHLGFGDYWILRDGTVIEVDSHDLSAQSVLEQDGVLSSAFKEFLGAEPDEYIPAGHFNHEAMLLGLGEVRWSTTGQRGVSTGGAKITDEQAGRISEMAGNSGAIGLLQWETLEPRLQVYPGASRNAYLDLEQGDHGTGITSLLEVRGGPGSGHFGHEGRLGEVGGSGPGEGGVEVYHGTQRKHAQEILRNGLSRAHSQDGYVWAATSRDTARDYGIFNSDRKPYAVVVIDSSKLGTPLPPSEQAARYGEQGKRAWDQNIPREAILRVEIWANKVGGKLDDEPEPMKVLFPQRSGGQALYVAVVLSDFGYDIVPMGPSGLHSSLAARGGPGSGHFEHEGRPGEVGGSAAGEGGPAPKSERVPGGQFSPRTNMNRSGKARGFLEDRISQHLGRPVTVGHGVIDEFYDSVQGRAPSSMWVKDEEGHAIAVGAADGGTYGWEPRTVALAGLFAYAPGERVYQKDTEGHYIESKGGRGSGLGTAVMRGLKDYVDAADKKLIVYSVANPRFFERFDWLEREDPDSTLAYRYQSIGYTLGRGSEEE